MVNDYRGCFNNKDSFNCISSKAGLLLSLSLNETIYTKIFLLSEGTCPGVGVF